MRNYKILERLATKYLIPLVILIVILVPILYYLILYMKVTNIAFLTGFIDISFKTIALFIGAIWTLNRLFISRTDSSHIKVEADLSKIHSSVLKKEKSLLVYRLDLLNSGNTLLNPYEYYIEIQSVVPLIDDVEYSTIYRFPKKGFHPGQSG